MLLLFDLVDLLVVYVDVCWMFVCVELVVVLFDL